ncbi:glycosyltransferase family 2 protein [Psychrobacillus sp. L3]|uniref:glycosyltransferase family 2 protein n=1 Tax=Psychrobacillus sp. L3 TaxID=3236891 RepID=UPI0036F1ADD3
MANNFVSIIMTAFNEEKYIGQAIDSILAQTYKEFELIIVDDGSSDSTPEIIKKYQDKRIQFFAFSENRGVGAAHAFAIEQAKGEFIAIADADDIHCPDRIYKQLSYLKENRNVGVVDCFVRYFADNEEIKSSSRYSYITKFRQKHIDCIVTPEDYQRSLYWFCSVVHSASMFYKKLIEPFNYSDLTVIEDYEVFYKMNKSGVKFGKVLEVLVDVRITSNSTTLAQNQELMKNFIIIKYEEIMSLVENNDNFYIWGTGKGGIDVAHLLKEMNVKVTGFLDNNEKIFGECLEGQFVEDYKEIDYKNSGILIVSSVGKFEIVKQLEKMELKEFEDFVVLL